MRKCIACMMLVLFCVIFGPSTHVALGQQQNQTTTKDSGQDAIKMETVVVTVHAIVSDSNQRYIKGLVKENFKIFEGKVEQPITYFDNDSVPRSIGVILDVSGSMTVEKIEHARKALEQFKHFVTGKDEFFLILFNKKVYRVCDFTNDIGILANALAVQAGSATALYDAVYEGAQYMMDKAKNPRRVLVVISDGQDNASRRSFGELKKLLREYDVLLYSFFTPQTGDTFWHEGESIMQDLAELTGGRMLTADTELDMEASFSTLALETSNQYTLGYEVEAPKHDGKWHDIKVKVFSALVKHLHIRCKSGYLDRK